MNVLIIGMGLLAVSLPLDHRASIEVLVEEEATGKPLPGLHVTGSFEMEPRPTWTNTGGPNIEEGITDIDGRCRFSSITDKGKIWCFVRPVPKEYYPWNCAGIEFERKDLIGKWQPDNLVATIRLYRVEHPVPLLVKEMVPKWKDDLAEYENASARYDLMSGDWLPPFGKGKVADLEIARLPRQELGEGRNGAGYRDRAFRDEVHIRFAGADNGLLEMPSCPGAGIMVRTAPESGYHPDYKCWRQRGLDLKWSESNTRDRNFCFRIRTRRDESGNIVEAYYGKIYHDIKPWHGNNYTMRGVGFMYYLNPNSLDRNLEWDRKNNLCTRGGAKTSLP